MPFEHYTAAAIQIIWSMVEIAAIALCLGLWLYRKKPSDFLRRIDLRSGAFNVTVGVLDALFISIPLSFVVFKFVSFIQLHTDRWTLLNLENNDYLPTAAIGLLAVFTGDFIAYWRHRLEHVGWFWKSHVMHHSDTNMNWSTIYRFHPVNRLTTAAIDMTALIVLGFPAWAILLNGLIRYYYGAFVHINQPWTLGPLGKILVSPAMHRWHHVLEGEGVGKNFASVFSAFDRLFGTHYCPGPCHAPLGVAHAHQNDLLGQYILPFRFRRAPPASDTQSRLASQID